MQAEHGSSSCLLWGGCFWPEQQATPSVSRQLEPPWDVLQDWLPEIAGPTFGLIFKDAQSQQHPGSGQSYSRTAQSYLGWSPRTERHGHSAWLRVVTSNSAAAHGRPAKQSLSPQ